MWKIISRWKFLTGVAAVVLGTATGFMLKAPALGGYDDRGDRFAAFFIAVFSSLSLWFVSRLASDQRPWLARCTAGLLPVILGCFVTYTVLLSEWTVQPTKSVRVLVMGKTLTDEAAAFAASQNLATNHLSKADASLLLMNYNYEVVNIWQNGYLPRWVTLFFIYVGSIVTVCAALMGAVYLVPNKKRRGGNK
jgi:hypothetical protein